MENNYEALENILLFKKPAKMLLNLYKNNKSIASRVAKETDITYSHVVKIFVMFQKHGLVVFEKIGREKSIALTYKGKEIASAIAKIFDILNKTT